MKRPSIDREFARKGLAAGVLWACAVLAGAAGTAGVARAGESPLKPQILEWKQPPTQGVPQTPTPAGSATKPSEPPSAPKLPPADAPTTESTPMAAPARPPMVEPATPAPKPKQAAPAQPLLVKPAPMPSAAPVAAPSQSQAGTRAAPAPTSRPAAVAAQPVPAPRRVSAVERLFDFQAAQSAARGGQAAQWISGRDATAAYERFLKAGSEGAAPADNKAPAAAGAALSMPTPALPGGVKPQQGY